MKNMRETALNIGEDHVADWVEDVADAIRKNYGNYYRTTNRLEKLNRQRREIQQQLGDVLRQQGILLSKARPYKSKHMGASEPSYFRASVDKKNNRLILHEFQSDIWQKSDTAKQWKGMVPFQKNWLEKSLQDAVATAKREGVDTITIPIKNKGGLENPNIKYVEEGMTGEETKRAIDQGWRETTPPGLEFRSGGIQRNFYNERVPTALLKFAKKYNLDYEIRTVGNTQVIDLHIPKDVDLNFPIY